jgi:hypothetical protein
MYNRKSNDDMQLQNGYDNDCYEVFIVFERILQTNTINFPNKTEVFPLTELILSPKLN